MSSKFKDCKQKDKNKFKVGKKMKICLFLLRKDSKFRKKSF